MTQRPKFWLVPGARAVTLYTQPANSFEKPSLDPAPHSGIAVAPSPDILNDSRPAVTHGGGHIRTRRPNGAPTLLGCLLGTLLVAQLVGSACRRADPPPAPARAQPARSAPIAEGRPVYKHSVIPGGVRDASELTRAAASDAVVARHYRDVNVPAVRRALLTEDRHVFVSYRRGDRVYWTRNKVRIPAGEAVLTDGTNEIRERCGNRISMDPLLPISEEEPDAIELDALLDDPAANVKATPPDYVSEDVSEDVSDDAPDDAADDEAEESDTSDPEDGLLGPPLLNARSSTGIPSSEDKGEGSGRANRGGRSGVGGDGGATGSGGGGGRGGSGTSSTGPTTASGDGNGHSTSPPGDSGTPPLVAPGPPTDDPSRPGNPPGANPDPPEYFDYDRDDDSSIEVRYGDPPIARVPEPGSLMLLGTGLGLGARYLLRRRTRE